MAKLLENIFRSVNIALVNELAELADRMGIDIHEVVDAAATKPYGFMRFDPGPGMGGHCLPVDPFYLSLEGPRARLLAPSSSSWPARSTSTRRTSAVEQGRARGSTSSARPSAARSVAVLGVAYKPGVGDIRESPALKIIARLAQLGAEVAYHDAFVPALPQLRPGERARWRTSSRAPTSR